MLKGNIKFIGKMFKKLAVLVTVLALVFPLNFLTALADPVPVEEVGWNREWNFRTSEYTNSIVELLGEIVGPVYQLSTPGSYLTKDIFRYMMKNAEDEFGVDKDFFRRMKQKQTAPTVDIVFAPTNPKVGEKVTAFAVPRGFRNSKEKLYYTWYIVHNVKTGDETPDVEAGKKEAMRLVAAGNYDKDLFGEPKGDDKNRDAYNASFGGDDGVGKKTGKAASEKCEGCQCLEGMSMFGGEVDFGCFDDRGELLYHDTDEYLMAKKDKNDLFARLGRGVINSEFISRCYRHNFGPGGDSGSSDDKAMELSGRDLIIKCQHAFGDSIGDRSFQKGEEDDWGTNPEDADTDGDGIVDEADLAGLGQDEFTWIYQKGDKVSVVVEGVSNIPINEGAMDRLRYKNKYWDGDEFYLDQSPPASPEQWYKDKRDECQQLRETASNNEYINCMEDMWEHTKWPENDEDAFGQMTGYYKIMWAAPGICSENRVDEAKNDWCDGEDDYGFQYLKLYDPVEQGKKLFEVSVNVSPKNPQFSEPDISMDYDSSVLYSDSTDMIFASADVVSDDNVNPDYLYYKWSVWRCEASDINTCYDVTEQVEFKSHKEGLGVREIGFYPTNSIFPFGNRTLLKIGVVVKRHQNSVMSSPGINGDYEKQYFSKNKKEHYHNEKEFPNKYAQIASKLLEVTKHNLKIKLYQADPTASGSWIKGKEICTEGLYKKICPVYPYQVLVAEVEGVAGAVSWKVNGHNIQPSLNQTVNTEVNSSMVFFPVLGTENALGRVTVTAEQANEEGQWEDSNMVEERVFSIHSPMAKLSNLSGTLRAGRMQLARNINGQLAMLGKEPLWWILSSWQGVPYSLPQGSLSIDMPVSVIPTYMTEEINGSIMTTDANGNSAPIPIGGVFTMSLYVDNELKGGVQSGDEGDSWSFNNVGFIDKPDAIHSAKVETLKIFSDDYKKALKQTFGVNPPNELVDVQKFKVKIITADDYNKITGNNVQPAQVTSWRKVKDKFFASTIQNAPEYLVFILRLAVSVVLVMGISFGVVYYGEKRI